MYNTLDDNGKSEILPLYNLDSENAGQALSQIGNFDAAKMITAAQQSTVANRVISDRLSTAFSMQTLNFNAGGLNFADGDENILMGVSANYNENRENNHCRFLMQIFQYLCEKDLETNKPQQLLCVVLWNNLHIRDFV